MALVVATVGCGGAASGTFVLLDLKVGQGTQPAEGIAIIALEVDLAGMKTTSTLRRASGTIKLPTTASLQVGQGQGALTVVARALDGLGVERGRGRGTGTVEREQTTTVALSIDFGVMATEDAGLPAAGADAGGAPSEDAEVRVSSPDGQRSFDVGGDVALGGQDAPLEAGARADVVADLLARPGDARPADPIDAGTGGANADASSAGSEAGGADVPFADAPVDLPPIVMVDVAPVMMSADVVAGEVDEAGTDAAEPSGGELDAAPDLEVVDSAVDLMPDAAIPAMLSVDKATHDFGNVVVNSMSSATNLTVTNPGGLPTGTLAVSFASTPDGQFAAVSDACSGATLAPGATCVVAYRFAPSMTGVASATVTVTATPGGMVTTTLSGTAITQGAITVEPSLSDFGSVVLGNLTERALTVRNVGGAPTGNVGISLGGTDATQFSIVSDACTGMAVAGGGTCNVTVRFAPNSRGFKSASLSAVAAPGGAGVATVTGTALAPALLAVAPTTHDFGQVNTNTMSAPVIFTVRNDGEEPSGIPTANIAGADAGQFSITGNTCTAAIQPAGTCTVSVLFAPTTYNLKNATLTVTASPGATAIAPLRGTGRDWFQLTVSRMGTGTGTVTSSEAVPLINCGAVCMANFARTTGNPTVTLTATPAVSSTFTSWQGCDSTSGATGNVCSITLAAAATVTPTFAIRTYTLTVNKVEDGGAAGGVTSQGATTPAIDCGATCSGVYNYGTTVNLVATPTMQYFGGWSGACSGFAGCSVAMTADRTVTARFNPANKVFVTPMPLTIAAIKALGSGSTAPEQMLSGADRRCNSLATAAGLSGNFVAFLSSNSVSAGARLGTSRGWLRVDGRPFADSLAAPLYSNQTFSPPMLDHFGNVVNVTNVGTASNSTGSLYSSSSTCNNWADNTSGASARVGLSSAAASLWASYGLLTCDQPLNLYCFQIDYAARVTSPPPPAMGSKLIFVSRAAGPTGGLANADAVCASDASGAGLSGTWKAMLATTTSSIASRFTTTGVPVYRPDGVLVAATDGMLFTSPPTLQAPINVSVTGTSYVTSYVWSGATSATTPTPMSATPYSCLDWTSNSSSHYAYLGYAGYQNNPLNYWIGANTVTSCSGSMRFYCLQD